MPSFFSFWTPPPHPIPHGVERSPAAGAVALPASGVAVLRFEPRSGVAEKGPHHVAAGAGGGGAGGTGADGGTSEKLATKAAAKEKTKDAEKAKDADKAAAKTKDAEIATLMSQLKAQLSGRPAGSAGARGGGAGGAGAGGPPTALQQGSPFQNTVSPPGT